MSTTRRAYDILRSQINHHWDRLTSSEYSDAWQELDGPAAQATQPQAQAQQRQQAAPSPQEEVTPEEAEQNQRRIAAKVLGVAPDACYDVVRKEYERLARRADPTKFSDGSEEQQRAAILRQQIEVAYRILVADVPVIEKRFKNLEIE